MSLVVSYICTFLQACIHSSKQKDGRAFASTLTERTDSCDNVVLTAPDPVCSMCAVCDSVTAAMAVV